MKKKYIPALILGLITLPALVYFIGNIYLYLFAGWALDADKCGIAVSVLITGGFLTNIAVLIARDVR